MTICVYCMCMFKFSHAPVFGEIRRHTTTHQSHGVETPMKITMPKNNKKIL